MQWRQRWQREWGVITNDHCRSCDAPIQWVKSTKNKWMPLNTVEVTEGVRFVVDQEGIAWSTVVGPGFMSHFATCPNAAKHRKAADDEAQGKLGL